MARGERDVSWAGCSLEDMSALIFPQLGFVWLVPQYHGASYSQLGWVWLPMAIPGQAAVRYGWLMEIILIKDF